MRKQPRRKKKQNVREVLERIEIVNVRLDGVSPAEYNPRKHTRSLVEDLKEGIRTFGMVDPIILNRRKWEDGKLVIVGGHARHTALKELSEEGTWKRDTMPAVIVEIDSLSEKALNVSLNKISGEFDYAKLPDVIESIRVGDASLVPRTGFKEPELRGLIVDAQASRVLFDEPGGEKRPVLKVEPRSEEEYKRVQRVLGSPGSQLLSMEKVLTACKLLRRKKK